MRLRTVAATALVLVLVAGCTQPVPVTELDASATKGYFAKGFAYNGVGAMAYESSYIALHANNATNQGTMRAEGMSKGEHWQFTMTKVAQAAGKDFQDGGIRFNFLEHGDTGVADTSIPKVNALIAAWGEGTVTVNGDPFLDLTTGNNSWAFHYMVVSTGVRDEEKRGIWTDAGKTKPFDTASPANGYAEAGDDEIMLVVKSKGLGGSDATVSETAEVVAEQAYNKPGSIPITTAYSILNVTLKVESTQDVMTPFDLHIKITGPDGVTRDYPFKYTPPAPALPAAQHIMLWGNQTGAFTYTVTGVATAAKWSIEGKMEAPKPFVLNAWWENVLHGTEADAFAATATLGGHEGHDMDNM